MALKENVVAGKTTRVASGDPEERLGTTAGEHFIRPHRNRDAERGNI